MNQSTHSTSTPSEASALAGIYRLLARLWHHEVDALLLDQLHDPSIGEAFTLAGGVLPQRNDAPMVEELAIDYCQLFIGPSKHLPPFQSVWQAGQFQGQATSSMKEWTSFVHYESSLLTQETMLDHLGVQLDVMGHILGSDNDLDERSISSVPAEEVAQTFFAKHLSWPAPLIKAAKEKAESHFYRSMIQLTEDFLGSEQDHRESASQLTRLP